MPEEGENDGPSLEPPSLFRRRRKAPKAASEPPQPLVEAEPAAPVAPPTTPPATPPTTPPATPPVAPPVAHPVTPLPERPPIVDESPTTIFDDTSAPTPDAPDSSPPEEPKPPREPWLGGTPAAALTGLFVGALIVAATAGSLRLCTAVKGTSSCGDSGFFLLVAILVVAVLVGAAMLRGARVPEPGSTSFLAVGLLSVVALLFLVGSIFQWWMGIVIPLASVATFLLSYWVTTTFIDPADDGTGSALERESHDVR